MRSAILAALLLAGVVGAAEAEELETTLERDRRGEVILARM